VRKVIGGSPTSALNRRASAARETPVASARVATELAFAGRGTHHTLANLGGAPARYLLVCTPGAFERYFDRLAAEATGVAAPPEASKPFPETIVVGPQIARISRTGGDAAKPSNSHRFRGTAAW
jgi:hypothetical protein